jgi:hypothetical protein
MTETVAQSESFQSKNGVQESVSPHERETGAQLPATSMAQQASRILRRSPMGAASLAPAEILVLQRTIGNQATVRRIAGGGKRPGNGGLLQRSSGPVELPDRQDEDLAGEPDRVNAREKVIQRQVSDPPPADPNAAPNAGPGQAPATAPPSATNAGQTPAPPGDPSAPAVWNVPEVFGGAAVNNGGDASAQLIDIKRQLEPLKDQFEGIPVVFSAIDKLLPETYGKDAEGPLKPDLASKLSGAGLAAAGAYNVALNELKAKLQLSLRNKEDKAATIEEKAADILHEAAFGKEADNEILEKAKEGFEKVHIFVEWSHYANEWVVTALQTAQKAKKFEEIAETLEHAGEFGERASIGLAALVSAMEIYSAMKISGDPGKSGTQKTVAQMKAGLSTVPVITAAAGIAGLTAAATGVGLLWTMMIPQISQGCR